ncbi:hypothetical protein QC760_010250 [Botrytis cinerea]
MATMASTYKKDGGHSGPPPRKKVKTSELPLASATRAAIEGLAHTYKKKGTYDELRTKIWQELEKGDFEDEFTSSLLSVAEEQLEKDPRQLLRLDRSKATLLIEGAVDRAGIYQSAEATIDKLIQAYIPEIEEGVRTIRKSDIGEEAAEKEFLRGGKTDEQYAEEAAKKKAAREKAREELREKEKAIPELSKEEIERLEQEALNDLLKEGKKVANRSRHLLEMEVDETLAPPPRKAMPASAIKPISRDTPVKTIEHKKTAVAKLKEESGSKTPQLADTKPIAEKMNESSHEKEGSQQAKSPESTRDTTKVKDETKTNEEFKATEVNYHGRKDKDERSRRGSRDRDDRRRRDSRDRDRDRDRRDSRDRDRSDYRRRRSSRDRDDRRDRDRIRSRSRDRRRSYRSRSRDRIGDRDTRRAESSVTRTSASNLDTESYKVAAAQARAEEARKWNEERKNQPQLPSLSTKKEEVIAATPRSKDDARMSSPVSARKREISRDRESHRRESRARSRSPTARRSSRIERSTSPINIDRYVPGATERKESIAEEEEPITR